MLILERTPSGFGAGTLGVPLEWTIYDPDRTVQAGAFARWDFLITENTATNGETFTIAGIPFSVDSSVPYTAESFAPGAIILQTARNFADMLLSSYRFRNYAIETLRVDGQSAVRVSIVAREFGEEIVEPLGGDTSGLSGIDLSFVNGAAEILANRRLWYQFWSGGERVGPQYAAYFDAGGRVTVDGQKQASSLVSVTAPDLTETDAVIDPLATAPLYMKYGTYDSGTDCEPTFGRVYTTPTITVANIVVQHELAAGEPDFVGFFQPPQFLTSRALSRSVRKQGYEWVGYLNAPGFLGGSRKKIVKTFFDASGTEIGETEQILEAEETGIVRIPIGYQNGVPEAFGEVARFTLSILTEIGLGYQPLSEVMELTVIDEDCSAAQVFFLEDLGSWRTIYFDRIEARRLDVEAVSILQPAPVGSHATPPTGVRSYRLEGGRGHEITESDATFVLATDVVTPARRKAVEEMLASPYHFIIADSDRGAILRRVIFDRSGYNLFQRSNPNRVQVPFTFNDPKRTR